ncbi:hypothetical protein KPH14_013072, partial [Odynerus spinipes]
MTLSAKSSNSFATIIAAATSNDKNFPSISTIPRRNVVSGDDAPPTASSSTTGATWLKSTITYSDVASCYQVDKNTSVMSGRQIGSIYSSQMDEAKSDLLNAAHRLKVRRRKVENAKNSSLATNHEHNSSKGNDTTENDFDDFEIKMILEDERSDRAKANILCFERLYRRVFCAHTVDTNGATVVDPHNC